MFPVVYVSSSHSPFIPNGQKFVESSVQMLGKTNDYLPIILSKVKEGVLLTENFSSFRRVWRFRKLVWLAPTASPSSSTLPLRQRRPGAPTFPPSWKRLGPHPRESEKCFLAPDGCCATPVFSPACFLFEKNYYSQVRNSCRVLSKLISKQCCGFFC